MLLTLWNLFLAFFRASIVSYGGGPASIPLMQAEVVSNYRWFTNEQFLDALAMGNSLPGPIAPKMAAYVGYHQAGVLGATVAVVATVAPTAILMVILARILLAYANHPRMQGMLRIAKPMVVALLLVTAMEMMTKKVFPGMTTIVIAAVTLVSVFFLKVHPAVVILVGLLLGFTFYKWI